MTNHSIRFEKRMNESLNFTDFRFAGRRSTTRSNDDGARLSSSTSQSIRRSHGLFEERR